MIISIKLLLLTLFVLLFFYILTLPKQYCIKYMLNNPTETLKSIKKEGFMNWFNTHTNWPFWNTQIGTTNTMSYDLRGDIPIQPSYVGPWLNSSTIPIYNKPLWMVS